MAFKLSHKSTVELSAEETAQKTAESTHSRINVLEAEGAIETDESFRFRSQFLSPQKTVTNPFPLKSVDGKRIPNGTVYGEIPLEAAKAYAIRIFEGTGLAPRIAYADLNTHGERNTLSVKLLPDGGKTAPHPQIVFFVNGAYHVEEIGYNMSDPFSWTTWMEFHLNARFLDRTIDAMIKAKLAMEGIKA